MSAPLDIARGYIARGWSPVPVPYKAKGPTISNWQQLRITEQDAVQFFNGSAQNIGVILGPASGGLTDVDLDCSEALALADTVLPFTKACFGRRSNHRSHQLYKTSLRAGPDES
jgi:hypothetical protein